MGLGPAMKVFLASKSKMVDVTRIVYATWNRFLSCHYIFVDLAYLARDNETSVILVDWSILAAFPYYKYAALHTEPVGKFVGEIIHLLS